MNIKTIKKENIRYFNVYAVRARKMDDSVTTHLMFLKREDAEENAERCRRNYNDIYKSVWVVTEPIFC